MKLEYIVSLIRFSDNSNINQTKLNQINYGLV